MLETKQVAVPLALKDGAAEGSVRAAFSVFDVVDSQGDVVLREAFTPGQTVPMVWSHDWTTIVGKGVVQVTREAAVFDGAFFLSTTAGRDAYETVKAMGADQEWSFGFQVLEAEPAVRDGAPVRLLTKLDVFEASPVLVGANRATRTLAIKADEKPFPNEHACRLQDPGKFDRFRRGDRDHEGKTYHVIYGHPEAGGGWEQQAFRYPTGSWSAEQARSHCAANDGSFEAAAPKAAAVPSFDEESDWLRSAASEYLEHARAGAQVRAQEKIGRPISEARRTRIATDAGHLRAVADDLDALLKETLPEPKGETPPESTGPVEEPNAELRALLDDFRRLQARHGLLTAVET